MPRIEIPNGRIEIPPKLGILDTGVLAARFKDDESEKHSDTIAYMELADYQWLVAPPVIVEACGLLSKRKYDKQRAAMMQWLQAPGNVNIFPAPHAPSLVHEVLSKHAQWMAKFEVDYVDAYLMEMANLLTQAGKLRPHAPIITYDTTDFMKCAKKGLQYSLIDMKSPFDPIDFS